MPPAPPTFSTITCWARVSLKPDARMRPIVSNGPPAANGTIMVTARRAGQSCARAGAVEAINASRALDTGLDTAMVRGTGLPACEPPPASAPVHVSQVDGAEL